METCYEYYTDEKWACISSDEKKVINRIMELHEAHPDEVVISNRPENNQGVMVAKIPRAWIKLPSPPKKRVLTDEQRREAGERMRNALNKRKKSATIDEDESDE